MQAARSGVLTVVLTMVAAAQSASTKTHNLIFVMTDGLRWQEVFCGADPALMDKEHGRVADVEAMRRAWWRETAQERRKALLPFLWRTVAKAGQIFGNRELGSDARVTNGHNFSYPGYSEVLAGIADPRIDSNDKNYNPNLTVLEWLNQKTAWRGKVAAFAAWDTFPFILNAPRAGFLINAGFDPLTGGGPNPRLELLNELKAEGPRVWEGEPVDSLTFHTALEYLKRHKPRVLFLSLGETDEWAHSGDYAQYLAAAHRVDFYLRTLWETVQGMPEYRGATTLIVATDHGRGNTPVDWKDHDEKFAESRYIWMAFLGPDTPGLGERSHIPEVTANQIAATLAAFLGESYSTAVPKSGRAIVDVLK